MLVMPMFVCSNFTGMTSIRPYIVRVFREFRPPMDAEWMTVMCSLISIIASVILILIVHVVGKRRLFLLFTAINAFTAIILGTYSFIFHGDGRESWIPILLFIVHAYCSTSVSYIPWMMVSEIYPFRTRGLSIGVSAAGVYLIVFCANKTYLGMEKSLGLHGSFWFFGSINFLALIYLYYTMLETEGKTLYEIERHFRRGLLLN
ncbi:Facilitated trehalose transporter Tret1 [Blattella germanica]|nr:Facilitated trehalose transporter Tret1 [Blattella germanica]